MPTDDGVPTTLPQPSQVPTFPVIEDRRQSFRMKAGTQAVLRMRGREIVAEMGNQSSGGFLVLLDKAPPFKSHEVGLLRTPRGWSSVRIAYIERAEERFRIGLEFLEDMSDPRDGQLRSKSGRRWNLNYGGVDWIFFFGVIAFGAVAGCFLIAYLLFPDMEIWRQLGRLTLTVREAWQGISPF